MSDPEFQPCIQCIRPPTRKSPTCGSATNATSREAHAAQDAIQKTTNQTADPPEDRQSQRARHQAETDQLLQQTLDVVDADLRVGRGTLFEEFGEQLRLLRLSLSTFSSTVLVAMSLMLVTTFSVRFGAPGPWPEPRLPDSTKDHSEAQYPPR